MNNTRIIRTVITFLIGISFSINTYAVFEGRDKSLEQYQSIRSEVELSPINQGKAYNGIDDNENPEGGSNPPLGNNLPISDSLSIFLLLGGFACGICALRGK